MLVGTLWMARHSLVLYTTARAFLRHAGSSKVGVALAAVLLCHVRGSQTQSILPSHPHTVPLDLAVHDDGRGVHTPPFPHLPGETEQKEFGAQSLGL